MNKIEMINQWLNQIKLSDEDHSLIQQKCPDNDSTVDETLSQEYFKRLPYSMLNSDEYDIEFNKDCTTFINLLFDTYVDDDTTVITTTNEHPSVEKNFPKCKNIIYLDENDIRYLNFYKLLNLKTSKVFVYIIGTHVRNGFYTPQDFYIKLRNELNLRNIKNVMVIDAVQELFLRPRDYTIFDYILGTAHAIVLPFDMGIMIHKKNDDIIKHTNEYNNCGKEYLKRLDIVLSKKYELNNFNHIMTDYFYDTVYRCTYYRLGDGSNASGNLFHIYINKDKSLITDKMNDRWFKEYSIVTDGMCIIRFRAQNYLYRPELLIPGINEIQNHLEELTNE